MAIQVKKDLKAIAEGLSSKASYTDAMYEIYVRMKISRGQKDLKEKSITSQSDVKKRFLK